MSHFVEVKDVKKIYRMGEVEIKALDGVDFHIEKGEFVVIVGLLFSKLNDAPFVRLKAAL